MTDDARDARRYRFLRNTFFTPYVEVPSDFSGDVVIYPPRTETFHDGISITKDSSYGDHLDEVIDAAIDGMTAHLYRPISPLGGAPIKMEGTRLCCICESSVQFCQCPGGPK